MKDDLDLNKAVGSGSCLSHDDAVNQLRATVSTEDLHAWRDHAQGLLSSLSKVEKKTEEHRIEVNLIHKKLMQISAALLPAISEPVEGTEKVGTSEYQVTAEGAKEREQRERQIVSRGRYTVELPDGSKMTSVGGSHQEAHDLAHAQHEYLQAHKGEPEEEEDISGGKRYFSPERKKDIANLKNSISTIKNKKDKKQLQDRLARYESRGDLSYPDIKRMRTADKKVRADASQNLAITGGKSIAHKTGTAKGAEGTNDVFTIFSPDGEELPQMEVPRSAGPLNERKAQAVAQAEKFWEKKSTEEETKKTEEEAKAAKAEAELTPAARKRAEEEKKDQQILAGAKATKSDFGDRLVSQARDHARKGEEKATGKTPAWHAWDHVRARDSGDNNWNAHEMSPGDYKRFARAYYKASAGGDPIKAVGGFYDQQLSSLRTAERSGRVSSEKANKQRSILNGNKERAVANISKRLDSKNLDSEHKEIISNSLDRATAIDPHSVPDESIKYHGLDKKDLSGVDKQLMKLTGSPLTQEEQTSQAAKLQISADASSNYFDGLRGEIFAGKGGRSWQSSHIGSLKAMESEARAQAEMSPNKKDREAALKTAGLIRNQLERGDHTSQFSAPPPIPQAYTEEPEAKSKVLDREVHKKIFGDAEQEGEKIQSYLNKKISHQMDSGEDEDWKEKVADFMATSGGKSSLKEALKNNELKLKYKAIRKKHLGDTVDFQVGQDGSLRRSSSKVEYLLYNNGKGYGASGKEQAFNPKHVAPQERVDRVMEETSGLVGHQTGDEFRLKQARGQTSPTAKNMRVLGEWAQDLRSHLSKERDAIWDREGIQLGTKSEDLSGPQKHFVEQYEDHHDKFIKDLIAHLSEKSKTFGILPKRSKYEFGEFLKKSLGDIEVMKISTLGAGLFLNIDLYKSISISEKQKIRAFKNSFGKDTGGVNPPTMNIESDEEEEEEVKKSLNLGFYVGC